MWRTERESRIVRQLEARGHVSIADLVRETGVSRETLRADLEALATAGTLRRVRGGAVLNKDAPEASFDKRMRHRMAAKLAIGRAAAALLPQGASIMVDAGSTTLALAHALADRPDLRVITNSLHIARILAATHAPLLLGGEPDDAAQGVYGEMTISQLRRFHVDIAVVSPVALDLQAGLSDFALREAELASAMFEMASRRMALAHADKIGQRSRVTIAPIAALDWIVTDAPPPDAYSSPPEWIVSQTRKDMT